ncbi:hypothetical protein Bca101_041794 [Brassica carinata]
MKNQLKKKLRRNKQEREIGYPNAVVVVKLSSGDTKCTQATDHLRQGTSMHVLNKKYPIVKFGLGCCGHWPNIKLPEWDPSSDTGAHPHIT